MATLTETLRVQHAVLEELEAQATEAARVEDEDTTRALLMRFEIALLAHLALEDAELYPRLLADEPPRRADAARTFSREMVGITEKLRAFLDTHSGDRLDFETFRREWPPLREVLRSRLRAEETLLYPLYESLPATDEGGQARAVSQG